MLNYWIRYGIQFTLGTGGFLNNQVYLHRWCSLNFSGRDTELSWVGNYFTLSLPKSFLEMLNKTFWFPQLSLPQLRIILRFCFFRLSNTCKFHDRQPDHCSAISSLIYDANVYTLESRICKSQFKEVPRWFSSYTGLLWFATNRKNNWF